ncbi:MAG: hypothetical protein KTR22_07245 [Flavobacteriaceae bacterium]|nr:hypothetical protein [Flavobacteriaceae bacterium]
MKLTEHCRVCEHQKFSLEEGSLCGVTMRKPNFHGICNKISLGDTFKEKIEDANIDFELTSRAKWKHYSLFAVYLILAIGILIISLWMFEYIEPLWKRLGGRAYFVYLTPFACLIILLKLLMNATESFGTFRSKFREATRKKEKVDAIAKLYGVSYEIDVSFEKDISGMVIPYTELTMKGLRS